MRNILFVKINIQIKFKQQYMDVHIIMTFTYFFLDCTSHSFFISSFFIYCYLEYHLFFSMLPTFLCFGFGGVYLTIGNIVSIGNNRFLCRILHRPSPSSRVTTGMFSWEGLIYGLSSTSPLFCVLGHMTLFKQGPCHQFLM